MPYRGAEIETLLAHSKAVAVACVSRAKDSPAELILSLRAKLPHLKHVIAVGDEPPTGALPFTSVAAAEAETGPRPNADDRFLLLYTSGTTAAPKGVPITYRKFLTNAHLSAGRAQDRRRIDPAIRRALHASLRAVLGQSRAGGRRGRRDPSGVHACGPRRRDRRLPPDRAVRCARPYGGVPERGACSRRNGSHRCVSR